MAETITVNGEFITLDLLLTRRHGFAGQALLEAAYDLNPGLAGLNRFIPLGTVVIIPDKPQQDELVLAPTYSLFD